VHPQPKIIKETLFMKVALIPPIPHLGMAKGRDYHLVLAHLVESSKEYQKFYRQEAINGSYIILDNSAHEMQHGQPIIKLLELAPLVGASEIVVPDALFDWKETSWSAFETFLKLTESGSLGTEYSWMFVPQGNTLREWLWSLDNFSLLLHVMAHRAPHLIGTGITLGISKDYEVFDGGLFSLLEDYAIPWADEYKAAIHMLGWGRELWELNKIAHAFGDRIRSVDSAKPFVYGCHGQVVQVNGLVPTYPKRPANYFDCTINNEQFALCWENIRAFETCALDGRI
jgi:hypothetical protein